MIGTNQVPWQQFAKAEGKDWKEAFPEALATCHLAGIGAWEPVLTSAEELGAVVAAVHGAGLDMPSVYCGARLHGADADAEVARLAAIGLRLAHHEGQYLVVNPDPVAWSAPDEKSDRELETQARSLSRLGEYLAGEGVRLLYHAHDGEMRRDGREFRAMLDAVSDEDMGLCLDAHWIYRGAGNRAEVVNDYVDRYLDRIETVHLRQSRNGVWTQTLGDGDLDWPALARHIVKSGRFPLGVLECAVEPGTEQTLSHEDAHRISRELAERWFPEPAYP